MERRELEPSSPELFQYPFLVIAGDQDFEPFSEAEAANIRRHLEAGGFLFADGSGAGFDRAFRREIAAILPGRPLAAVRRDHVIFKSFYLIDAVPGRVINSADLEAIEMDQRLAVVYTQNDFAGAWARDNFGQWEYDVSPGGVTQREMTFRMGVNIVAYALSLDYKDDQVHIPFIMRRRR